MSTGGFDTGGFDTIAALQFALELSPFPHTVSPEATFEPLEPLLVVVGDVPQLLLAPPPSEPELPHTSTGAATAELIREADPELADVEDVAGAVQDADPPTELPQTVAGAATGTAADEPLELEPEPVFVVDVVPVELPDALQLADDEPTELPHTVAGAATGAAADGLPEPDPVPAVDVVPAAVPDPPQLADDDPTELPHTVAGAATGAAADGLPEPEPEFAVDVAPVEPPQLADDEPTELPHTVAGAATGAVAFGSFDVVLPDVPVAEFAVPLEAPDPPQLADDEPTELPHTVAGAETGAVAEPAEPDDAVAGDPLHCAEPVPFVLTELPHTFTGALTGAVAFDAEPPEAEPPAVDPDAEPDCELAPVPFGPSTDTELLLTLAGAATGTLAACEEPGVDAPPDTLAVVDCCAADETGWVTGLPAGPIATEFPPTVTGAVTLVPTAGAGLGLAGVAADAMPAPSSHAPPVKTPAYRHRFVQVFMMILLRSTESGTAVNGTAQGCIGHALKT